MRAKRLTIVFFGLLLSIAAYASEQHRHATAPDASISLSAIDAEHEVDVTN